MHTQFNVMSGRTMYLSLRNAVGYYRQDENNFYLSSGIICLLITLYVLYTGPTVQMGWVTL